MSVPEYRNAESTYEGLKNSATELMGINIRIGVLKERKYQFTIPSKLHYPFQWFWDSCFHAIILSGLGKHDRAKGEIEALLAWQRNDGFIPHVVFWDQSKVQATPFSNNWNWLESEPFFSKPRTSAEIQPPILAQAAERVFAATQDQNWLEMVLPRIGRYYNYLDRSRRVNGSNPLIVIFAPFESGLDQSPAYDLALAEKSLSPEDSLRMSQRVALQNKLLGWKSLLMKRFGPFQVVDVLVNSLYAQGLLSLGNLYGYLGNSQEREIYHGKSNLVVDSLTKHCWDPKVGIFWNVDARTGKHLKVKTIISLMPLILPQLPKEFVSSLVRDHLLNTNEFYLEYPIPSVAVDESAFREDDCEYVELNSKNHLVRPLWRGTTWVNTNYLICKGLRLHGFEDLANQIAEKTKKLVLQHGFCEYFNPRSGQPGRLAAKNFGWSTLAADL